MIDHNVGRHYGASQVRTQFSPIDTVQNCAWDALQRIWQAPDRRAEIDFNRFVAAFDAKYTKAVDCIGSTSTPPIRLSGRLLRIDAGWCIGHKRIARLMRTVAVAGVSRRIVGWCMATHMRSSLVLDALDMALAQRKPDGVIHHSDQGASTRRSCSASAAGMPMCSPPWARWAIATTTRWLCHVGVQIAGVAVIARSGRCAAGGVRIYRRLV